MMRWLSAAALLGALACGGSTSGDAPNSGGDAGVGGGGASGGTGGQGATSSGGTGGYCESFVPCCDSQGKAVDPVCPTPGDPKCPPGATWPPTGFCTPGGLDCTPTQPCAQDQYCDYPDNRCGNGVGGKCKTRPLGCDLIYAPVCACGGSVAGNDCAAYSEGLDLNEPGGCEAPSGMFACGEKFCSTSQYCSANPPDVSGIKGVYSCKQPPAACGGTPTCECVKGPGYDDCTVDAEGNVTAWIYI